MQYSITIHDGKSYIAPSANPSQTADDVQEEYWDKMAKREVRVRLYWKYVEASGFKRDEIRDFARDNKAERFLQMDLRRLPFLSAFVLFAQKVGIDMEDYNDYRENRLVEPLTIIQEHLRWEDQFKTLVRFFGVSVVYVGLRSSDEFTVPKERTCFLDHRSDGFVGQEVFVWYGNYKNRYGTVTQENDGNFRVVFDSVVFGMNIVVIEGQNLLVYVCFLSSSSILLTVAY